MTPASISRTVAAAVLGFAAAGAIRTAVPADGPPAGAKPAFVAHEWGTFTSIAGADGAALEWRPLAGRDDLPKFVHRSGAGGQGLRTVKTTAAVPGQKFATAGTVRMETPIIYFYSDRERDVKVKVGFPGGTVTEWYPWAFQTGAAEAELEKILIGEGLYEKEAKAMVKAWRGDWFEEGIRVFYVVPRRSTDGILPLTIEPRPDETVRVLVGRVELITPEREAAVRKLALGLGDASYEVREKATESLAREGRFAEPVLKKVLEETRDLEVKARIEKILTRENLLAPPPAGQ